MAINCITNNFDRFRLVNCNQIREANINSLAIVDKYIDWFNDKRVNKYLYSCLPKSKQEVESWVFSWGRSTNMGLIVDRQDNRLIGHVSSTEVDDGVVEVGVVVGEVEYWGCGIASYFLGEQSKCLVGEGKRVVAYIHEKNFWSQKLFSKIGYVNTYMNNTKYRSFYCWSYCHMFFPILSKTGLIASSPIPRAWLT